MTQKKTIKRYILFQIPELLITFLALQLIQHFFPFPQWIVWAVMCGAIIKDVIMFRYTWKSYIVHNPEDYINIKGQQCTAISDFDSKGLVRINGELWQAQSADPVKKDEKLIVYKVNGLELFVKKITD